MRSYVPKKMLPCPEVSFLSLRGYTGPAVVALQRCESEEEICEATAKAVKMAGLERVVRSGDRVLLKTNASHPKQKNEGAVVDPRVVLSVAECAFESGAREVYIADGSSERGKSTIDVFNFLGYDEVVKKTGANLVDLNLKPYVRAKVPGGGFTYDDYVFNELITKVDVLISIMKMKTHSEARVALGMKNLIGLVPFEPVKGYRRWIYMHPGEYVPEDTIKIDYKEFLEKSKERYGKSNPKLHGVITDVNLICPISMTVIDGFIGMEGNGPWLGDIITPKLILAGFDPLASDSIAATIMGFDPRHIEHFTYAKERGIGEIDPNKIEIRCLSIKEARCPFKPGVTDTILL
jgi:uncharacterized protein (DUF362 family)